MSLTFPVTEDPRYRRYTAAAGQTVFNVPFPFQQDGDIQILLQVAPSQYEPFGRTEYSVSGAGDPAGGSITLDAPRAAGDIVLILGQAVIDRLTSIVTNGRFRSDLTDGELDRNRIILLEERRENERSLKTDYGGAGYVIASDLEDGDVLMKDGQRFVRGPRAAEISAAQANAESALASAGVATVAAAAALERSSEATAARDLAQRFAGAPEDEEVLPGSGLYSSRHFAAKASRFVTDGVAAAIEGAIDKDIDAGDYIGFLDGAAGGLKRSSFRDIADAIIREVEAPVGSILTLYGNGATIPACHLLMTGFVVDPDLYPELWEYGRSDGWERDGAGNPICADAGGYFERGWRPGQVVDSGRVFGAPQEDALQNITGNIGGVVGGTSDGPFVRNTNASDSWSRGGGSGSSIAYPVDFDASLVARTADETRPRNYTVTRWIKFCSITRAHLYS